MIVKVRTQPIDVYLVTGDDLKLAADAAHVPGLRPLEWALVTESHGEDGHFWTSPEEFEADYAASFGDPGIGSDHGTTVYRTDRHEYRLRIIGDQQLGRVPVWIYAGEWAK